MKRNTARLSGVVVIVASLTCLIPQVLGAGTLDAADKKVAARVEELLRERVSSPDNKLKLVITPTEKADQGYFSEVVIEGQPVQIKKLRLAEFSLRARNVRISLSALAQNKIQTIQAQSQMRAVITEEDLTARLAKGKHSKQMGLKVKYLKDPALGDMVKVSGNWSWALLSGPVSGTAKLRLDKNDQVWADIITLQLNGREVPAFVKGKFSEKINPLFDCSELPFQPQVRGVKVEGTRAIIF